MSRWLTFLLLCLLPIAVPAQDVAVPALTARITDLTGTLESEQLANLEARLKAIEAKQGTQVAVLLVTTTGPETIEQYSLRVVEQWQLGRKKVDDGVLLLLAKNDRKLRIEVGYGLEGILPDAICKRIIDEDITPHLKRSDFNGGISAGINRIDTVLGGEELPAQTAQGDWRGNWSGSIFYVILIAVIGSVILRRTLGTFLGSLANGCIAGFATLWMSGIVQLSIFAGFFVFVFTLSQSGGSSTTGGGFSTGGGGFSGGGGGFSGGGGSFGGGGASGSW